MLYFDILYIIYNVLIHKRRYSNIIVKVKLFLKTKFSGKTMFELYIKVEILYNIIYQKLYYRPCINYYFE